MKTKILSIVSVVVLLATLFAFSASAATDIIDNFEQVKSNTLTGLTIIQARPGLKATNKVKLDTTTAPALQGVENKTSLRIDYDINAGEEWSQFKLPFEDPQMLNASVLGKNDAVYSLWMKAKVTQPVNVGLVIKDERWVHKVLVTTEWKRYDIKLTDFHCTARTGDPTVASLVKSGAYNEAYVSEYTFLVSSSAEYKSGKTTYSTPMKSTFWVDEVSFSGTEIKDQKSEYKRDRVKVATGATTTTTTTTKPVANVTTVDGQKENTVTTTVAGEGTDATTTVDGEQTDVTTVEGETATTTTNDAAANATTKPENKENKNSATPIIIGVIVVVVLAAGGAVLYFLKIKKK